MQTETTFDDLLLQLSSWDGSWEKASELRVQARRHKPPQRAPKHPAEAALFVACSSYQNKKPISSQKATQSASLLAPFLGDQEMGRWPFDDPQRISDEEAIAWLPVLGRYALVTEALRQFVFTFFTARRREVWLPASLALAWMSTRDEESRSWLQDKFARAYPDGLPSQWPKGRLTTQTIERAAHDARHVLHCSCVLASLGGAAHLQAFSYDKFAAMSLPKDEADGSLVLLSLSALIEGSITRAATLAKLPERIKELSKEGSADEMQEEALRGIADLLRAEPSAVSAFGAITSYLRRDRWRQKKGGKQLDALWSWLETAAWLSSHGDTAGVDEMRQNAKEAGPAFSLRLQGSQGADPIEPFVMRLRALYDESLFATTPPAERVSSIAALLLLLQDERVAPLSWRHLGVRTLDASRATDFVEGAAQDVAAADLLLLLTKRKMTPALFMRGRALPRAVVLALASSQDGFVARQVAVQMERLLRQESSGEAQVKLLWSLLQQNPPPETFRELRSILRGEETPLHQVVQSISALDELRAESDKLRRSRGDAAIESQIILLPKKLADEYRNHLAPAAARLLQESQSDPGLALCQMASALQQAGDLTAQPEQRHPLGSPEWLSILRAVLMGEPPSNTGGIDEWMRWLGAPVDDLRQAWESFESAARALFLAEQLPTEELCLAVEQETRRLQERLARLAWPESRIVGEAVELIDHWRAERLELVRSNAHLAESVSQWLYAGDEEKIEGFVAGLSATPDAATLDRLPPALIRRLHSFLLHHLLLAQANALRARVNPKKVQLSSVAAYLFPLLGGVGGGVFNVLGGTWNEVILEGHTLAYWATAVFSLFIGFALLSNDLSAQMIDRDSSSGRRARRIVRRVLPIFGATFMVALVMASLTLWTLAGTASREIDGQPIPFLPQAFLWACLSLFFGVFLGLVLQGRSAAKQDS